MSGSNRRMGRPAALEITPPQRRTLREIERFTRKNGYPPTTQELAECLGIASPSAYDQVSQLIRKGYLKRETGKARSLTIIRSADDKAVERLVSVPHVGSVAAGQPLFAEENVIGEILVEEHVAQTGRCFALTVAGDSMKRAGIHDGDVVIVRQQQLAESGDIVVALVDGEATVKRLHLREQIIELRPENPRYRPLLIGPDVDLRILGKVVATRGRV